MYCKYGCYPVDEFFYKEKGLDIEEALNLANIDYEKRKLLKESLNKEGITHIKDIISFKRVVESIKKFDMEIGEKIIDKMGEKLKYSGKLGEPYVRDKDRVLVVSSSVQGKAMNVFRFMNSLIDNRYGFNIHKIREWLNISPRSTLYEEMMGRKRNAERTVNEILAALNDLYQQKHLLEHDLRKLYERKKSFEEEGKGREESLKADFVDLVDVATGPHSILEMQRNNVFPTIMADFFRMTSEDDLTVVNGKKGILSDLPENEKAILRKKWKLYTLWKEEYKKVIYDKIKDLERRRNSIIASINNTEEMLRPYIRTLMQIKNIEEEDLDKITDVHLIEGYSTGWRGMKILASKSVREEDGEETHYDVLIIFVDHLTLASTQQPQMAGQGGEALIFKFKEYLVCKHVYEIAFQSQIDAKKEEVKRFLQLYTGEVSWEDEFEKEFKVINNEDKKKKEEFKKGSKISLWFGDRDKFYVPPDELPNLRRELIGPKHTRDLYLDLKYGTGMFVMS